MVSNEEIGKQSQKMKSKIQQRANFNRCDNCGDLVKLPEDIITFEQFKNWLIRCGVKESSDIYIDNEWKRIKGLTFKR